MSGCDYESKRFSVSHVEPRNAPVEIKRREVVCCNHCSALPYKDECREKDGQFMCPECGGWSKLE